MTSKQRAWQSTPKAFVGRPAAPKLCCCEAEPLWRGSTGSYAPQVDRELPDYGDNDLFLACDAAGRSEESLAPLGDGVISGLMA
jgi:hypothetical protein